MMKAKQYSITNINDQDMNEKTHVIHSAISGLQGINAVRVDPYRNTVTVDFDDGKVSEKEIQEKLRQNNFM